MANQASLGRILSDNTTKIRVLELIVDYLVTNNSEALKTPSPDEIKQMIDKANKEINRRYPPGTNFS